MCVEPGLLCMSAKVVVRFGSALLCLHFGMCQAKLGLGEIFVNTIGKFLHKIPKWLHNKHGPNPGTPL